MQEPSTIPYFLAIDAGGTKTELLLADSARELARVRTGSIKRLNTAAEVAESRLAAALAELESLTGVDAGRMTRTCVGASGFSVPLVADWLRAQLRARVAGELVLCGDEEIALDAAFEGRPGVLALAGTGSNVIARDAAGRILSAGGWGPVLGDEGSGHWIGLEGVRAALRARDEQRPSLLLDAIQEAWGLDDLREVIQRGNASSSPGFADLTPVVLRAAEGGDAVAAEVLARAGEELARTVRVVLERMDQAAGPEQGLPPVALAGSILQEIAPVRESMIAALHCVWPGLVVRVERVNPVLGALWRARHPAGR